MQSLVFCDDADLQSTISLCHKYKRGIEIQSFYDPQILQHVPDAVEKHRQALESICMIIMAKLMNILGLNWETSRWMRYAGRYSTMRQPPFGPLKPGCPIWKYRFTGWKNTVCLNVFLLNLRPSLVVFVAKA